MKTLLIPFIFLVLTTGISRVARGQETTVKTDIEKAEIQKAKDLIKQDNRKEASKILTGIMESHPGNKEAVQLWLIENMKRGLGGELGSIRLLDSLGRIYPKNTGIPYYKAFIFGEHGKNELALAEYDRIIRFQPRDADSWISKGQILYELKRFDEALAAFNKGVEINPDDPLNYYNRACIYSLKGDKANALADLKKAIGMNPSMKQNAIKDKDFKNLWKDADFKKLMDGSSGN